MNGRPCHAEVNEGGKAHEKSEGKFHLSTKPVRHKVWQMKLDRQQTTPSNI
jgi:hypothetical protein